MSFILYAIFAILFLAYKFLKHNVEYFEKRGLKYLKPTFLVGSRTDMILRNKAMTDVIKEWYDQFPKEKVIGFFEFTKPSYIIRDPKLLKRLTVKEFDAFPDHRNFLDEKVDPLFGRALFSLRGQKWKDMRATLSPAFTGSKMRQMFELVAVVGEQVAETLKQQIKAGGNDAFEFKELARRFTVDCIATCAFGIEVNSFKSPNNDFFRIAGKTANFGGILNSLKFMGYFLIPRIMTLLNINFFDNETTSFFQSAIHDTMKAREEKGIVRHDMINLMIQAKKGSLTHEKESTEKMVEGFATVEESTLGKTTVKRQWEDDDLTAQCFIFFFAGFETISTAMTFMAYELVVNPDCQKKLQQEIDEMNENIGGKRVNYEQVQGMKYMDQVVCETLRKWPPAPLIDRLAARDTEIEYDDGKRFMMEKDTNFYMPIYGFHHDEKYFPNPAKFDPERFSEENRKNIDPDTYLPFGIGPRNCIGSRFALMELKTIIYYLLLNFDFVATKKSQIPLQLAPNPFQLQVKGGAWIGLKPRK